ncbi:MAG: hypothetical protein AB7P33_15350 [Dehalococcoidia bacterium]
MAILVQCAEFVTELSASLEHLQNETGTQQRKEYVVLDIGQLRSMGYLSRQHETGVVTLGRRGALATFSIDRDEASDAIVMRMGDATDAQVLPISATAPSFGGNRYWFRCPGLSEGCGERAQRLYRTMSGSPYACRACHQRSHDSGWRTARDRELHVPVILPGAE